MSRWENSGYLKENPEALEIYRAIEEADIREFEMVYIEGSDVYEQNISSESVGDFLFDLQTELNHPDNGIIPGSGGLTTNYSEIKVDREEGEDQEEGEIEILLEGYTGKGVYVGSEEDLYGISKGCINPEKKSTLIFKSSPDKENLAEVLDLLEIDF